MFSRNEIISDAYSNHKGWVKRIPERLEGQIPTVQERDGKPKVEHEGEEDDITTAWTCFISRQCNLANKLLVRHVRTPSFFNRSDAYGVGPTWCELVLEGTEGEAGCGSMLLGGLSLRACTMNCLECTKLHVSSDCYYVFEVCPKKCGQRRFPEG